MIYLSLGLGPIQLKIHSQRKIMAHTQCDTGPTTNQVRLSPSKLCFSLTFTSINPHLCVLSFILTNNFPFLIIVFFDPTKGNPGPGSYQADKVLEMVKDRSIYSKYRDSGSVILTRAGKRFDDRDVRKSMAEPGPGEYAPEVSVNSTGRYFLGRYRNGGAPIFSKQKRVVELETSATRKITPGPGSYRL